MREILELVGQSFRRSVASRVITDEVDLVDEDKKPIYSFSAVVADTNRQSSDEAVRPVRVSYILRDDRVDRSYATINEEATESRSRKNRAWREPGGRKPWHLHPCRL